MNTATHANILAQSGADSLAFNQQSGNPKDIAHDLLGLGEVALHAGDAAEAERLHQASLALSRQAGYRSGMVRALVGLGDIALAKLGNAGADALAVGDVAGGLDAVDHQPFGYYEAALHAARDISAIPWVLAAAVGMASVWARAGGAHGAVELLTLAVYHPASNHRTRQRAARLLSRLEADGPADDVSLAEERGRHSQLEDAIGRLLDDHLPPA